MGREHRRLGRGPLPLGDRRGLRTGCRKSDTRSDPANALYHYWSVVTRNKNSRIPRDCEGYGCSSTPTGSRTPVFGLRTRRPGPLDDGGLALIYLSAPARVSRFDGRADRRTEIAVIATTAQQDVCRHRAKRPVTPRLPRPVVTVAPTRPLLSVDRSSPATGPPRGGTSRPCARSASEIHPCRPVASGEGIAAAETA